MKLHHSLWIIFLVLMAVMLLGGLVIFIQAVMHPQTFQPWRLLVPAHA